MAIKTAVVTGAGGGIGRAIAQSLARAGARLCLVGRTERTLEETAVIIRKDSPRVLISVTDLTVDEQTGHLADSLRREFGEADLLVHSSGVISRGKVETEPARDFDRQYHANVRGPYVLTQQLLPLIRVCSGQIVFINSSVGLRASPGASQFSATQHALKALADSLREEVNPDGIRVLSVYPGRTATSRQAALYEESGEDYRAELLLQPEDIAAIVLAAVSLPRTAEVTDISIRPLIKSYWPDGRQSPVPDPPATSPP